MTSKCTRRSSGRPGHRAGRAGVQAGYSCRLRGGYEGRRPRYALVVHRRPALYGQGESGTDAAHARGLAAPITPLPRRGLDRASRPSEGAEAGSCRRSCTTGVAHPGGAGGAAEDGGEQRSGEDADLRLAAQQHIFEREIRDEQRNREPDPGSTAPPIRCRGAPLRAVARPVRSARPAVTEIPTALPTRSATMMPMVTLELNACRKVGPLRAHPRWPIRTPGRRRTR